MSPSRSAPTSWWEPTGATRRSHGWAGSRSEYEHHDFDVIWFTIEQPPGWSSTFYVSLGEVRGLMLPKYPHHIQAGILLPTGEWKRWRDEGVAVVAERVRRFDPIFRGFADSLRDFKPFFPLEGIIRLVRDWARDGLLLIGDAAHTMSPAGAIGVNVALATAAVAAQELYPHLGHGPIKREVLQAVQRLREDDVRTLHRFQLAAQGVLLRQGSRNPVVKWLAQTFIPLFVRSPLLPQAAAPALLRRAAAAAGPRVQLSGASLAARSAATIAAGPAGAPLRDVAQQPEGTIHGVAVRKGASNVGLQENQVGARHCALVVLASLHAFQAREIVFATKIVSWLLRRCLLHTVLAPGGLHAAR